MAGSLDYVAHLRAESARFGEVLAGVSDDAQVPTCPEWTASDLLWHLTEVQWFWGVVVQEGLVSQVEVDALTHPERPRRRSEVAARYAAASSELVKTLTGRAPTIAAWTWADDQTVGFIMRRQAHEALVHRLDAELTARCRTPLDPDLSADGVDEALRVMLAGVPRGRLWEPDHRRTLRISATDTGHTWVATLGAVGGDDPDLDGSSGKGSQAVMVAATDEGRPVAAEVRATAADLNCFLWGRPGLAAVSRSGDHAVQAAFSAIVGRGID
jgi:uncharacterized protein (TIGR03083 family)